jgi:hypothetical protein
MIVQPSNQLLHVRVFGWHTFSRYAKSATTMFVISRQYTNDSRQPFLERNGAADRFLPFTSRLVQH